MKNLRQTGFSDLPKITQLISEAKFELRKISLPESKASALSMPPSPKLIWTQCLLPLTQLSLQLELQPVSWSVALRVKHQLGPNNGGKEPQLL